MKLEIESISDVTINDQAFVSVELTKWNKPYSQKFVTLEQGLEIARKLERGYEQAAIRWLEVHNAESSDIIRYYRACQTYTDEQLQELNFNKIKFWQEQIDQTK